MATGESHVVIHEPPQSEPSQRERSRSRSPLKFSKSLLDTAMDIDTEEQKDVGTLQENTAENKEDQVVETQPEFKDVGGTTEQATLDTTLGEEKKEVQVGQSEPTDEEKGQEEIVSPDIAAKEIHEIAELNKFETLEVHKDSFTQKATKETYKSESSKGSKSSEYPKPTKKAESLKPVKKEKHLEIPVKAKKEEHKPESHVSTRSHKEEILSPIRGRKKVSSGEEKGTFSGPDGSKWKIDKLNPRDDELSTVICVLCDREMKRKSIKTHISTKVHKKNKE